MQNTAIRTATFLALATALISGASNFINKYAVAAVGNPILFTALKNVVVAALLIGVVLTFRKWNEIRSLSRNNILKLAAIGIVGGSLPFALFFSGLALTPAINAALIHKTLFLWVALLAIPLLKERMTPLQWVGIGAIAVANFAVGGFKGFEWNMGELLILSATILWAVENVIAKIVLHTVSSETVAAARMVIGSLVLLPFAFARSGGAAFALSNAQWGWVALTSIFLLGYVLTWYSALKRAPATYVATLLVPATLVTNLLSAAFVTHALPTPQMVSGVLFVLGVVLVIAFPAWRKPHALPQHSI